MDTIISLLQAAAKKDSDRDPHAHIYDGNGVCTVCGAIKYMSRAYCEIHHCDPRSKAKSR